MRLTKTSVFACALIPTNAKGVWEFGESFVLCEPSKILPCVVHETKGDGFEPAFVCFANAACLSKSTGIASGAFVGLLLAGTVLITLSSQVKLPGLLALGFTAMALAHRWGGTWKAFLSAGVLTMSVALAVTALVGWASGLGFGWLFTLGTANVVRSWMSPPTLLALATGQVGILLGLGDHTTAVLSLTRAMGVLIIAIMVTWLLLAVLRGRLHPVGGLGVAMGATVLLFPVVQPWYLLWAIIPLAAWATRPRFRIATIAVTLIVGIFGPTANGDRFALFQILNATLASAVIVLLLIGLTLNRLPWRYVPGTDERYSGEDLDSGSSAGPSRQPPATGPARAAYADSP